MTQLELNFVNPQRGRDGRVRYWYFRRAGRRWRLPDEPFSPTFMIEYQRLLAATEPARPGKRGLPPAWRDARNETPGMANMVVRVVRALLTYSVDNEYRKDNPAQCIKLFKLGKHRAWSDEDSGERTCWLSLPGNAAATSPT
jgi:hypothetical protein